MQALDLIRRSTYGPERLKQIFKAFDEAWEAIKPVVEDNPLAHEAARLKLANTILSVAKGDAIASGITATEVPSNVASLPPTKKSCS